MTRPLDDSTLDHLRRIVADDAPDHPRYCVRERIGQGGMGTVWLADDLALNRPVAVKVLRDIGGGTDSVERMQREAQVVARLEHPGIVPVHDVGRLDDGRVFYVMKWVKGRRLDEHFAPTASIPERLRVFERVCQTAAFAHARGVIHRDLKPQNVMVGEFGEVLVLDWGVAKVLDRYAKAVGATGEGEGANGEGEAPAEPRLAGRLALPRRPKANDGLGTSDDNALVPAPPSAPSNPGAEPTMAKETAHGTILGTPAYMPPEQERGDLENVDQRSDVYALGGILYFLLTRRAPREGREDRDPVPPRQVNQAVPRRLDAICRKALSPDPADRYASASELAADIFRYLNEQPVQAYHEGPLERVGRWLWRYRTPILLILAYLVMRAVLILVQRSGAP